MKGGWRSGSWGRGDFDDIRIVVSLSLAMSRGMAQAKSVKTPGWNYLHVRRLWEQSVHQVMKERGEGRRVYSEDATRKQEEDRDLPRAERRHDRACTPAKMPPLLARPLIGPPRPNG